MAKKYARRVIDVVMALLAIYLMSRQLAGQLMLHALAGVAVYVLFIVHHVLNWRWYRPLCALNRKRAHQEGGRSGRFALNAGIDIALLVAMLVMMATSVLLSNRVASFGVSVVSFAADLHVFAGAWFFVLMSVHLGMHCITPLGRLFSWARKTAWDYIVRVLAVLVCFAGLFFLVQSGVLWEMAFQRVTHPYAGPIEAYLSYAAMMASICLIVFALARIAKGKN